MASVAFKYLKHYLIILVFHDFSNVHCEMITVFLNVAFHLALGKNAKPLVVLAEKANLAFGFNDLECYKHHIFDVIIGGVIKMVKNLVLIYQLVFNMIN